MLKIAPISIFEDNYVWLIHTSGTRASTLATVVDPGDARAVLTTLAALNLELGAILITHHHRDHIGGVAELVRLHKSVVVFAAWNSPVDSVTHRIKEGDTIDLPGELGRASVIATPGHTLDHVCYLLDNHLFCGDTLFSAGCGRLFEGTPEQMLASLNKIAELPTTTYLYPAHEYTYANLKFAREVESNNPAIEDRIAQVIALRNKDLPSLPTTLATELTSNPFLRCANDEVHHRVERHAKRTLLDKLEVFTELRLWKDTY